MTEKKLQPTAEAAYTFVGTSKEPKKPLMCMFKDAQGAFQYLTLDIVGALAAPDKAGDHRHEACKRAAEHMREAPWLYGERFDPRPDDPIL